MWLLRWLQQKDGRWRQRVGPGPFRFAVTILTLFAFIITAWVHIQGPDSLGHYLLASYALGQGLNVFFPHLIASITTRRYVPGLLTGLVFVLPLASVFLVCSFAAEQLRLGRFLLIVAVFIPLMLLSILVLFKMGKLPLVTFHFNREK